MIDLNRPTVLQDIKHAVEAIQTALPALNYKTEISNLDHNSREHSAELERHRGRLAELERVIDAHGRGTLGPGQLVPELLARVVALEELVAKDMRAVAKPAHLRSVTDIEDDRLRGYSRLMVNGVAFVEERSYLSAQQAPQTDESEARELVDRLHSVLERVVNRCPTNVHNLPCADRAQVYSALADSESYLEETS